MFIEPNSLIRLISNCPLDNTYEHTLYWDSISAQTTYFESIAKHRLDKYSYQSYASGVMKVNLPAEQLYDCNYLMFQNTSFGSKWFYAFVKSVEYINNVTTEIRYEMDVMQTWFFDYELGECFVEREHSATDIVGENTVEENLERGPYIVTAQKTYSAGKMKVFMLATEPIGDFAVGIRKDPGIIGGFVQACYTYELGDIDDPNLGELLTTMAEKYSELGKADAIVSIFCAPSAFVSTGKQINALDFTGADRVLSKTPKNKKLYTYPYCANVLMAGGQACELRYELFNGNPSFIIYAGFGANMSVICRPKQYAGLGLDIEHTITLNGWPVVAWVSDYYQNWLAQNANRQSFTQSMAVLGGFASAGMLAGSLATGNVHGALAAGAGVVGSFSRIGELNSLKKDMAVIPDTMHGSAEAVQVDALVNGALSFFNFCKSIRPEYIDIIDDYFSRFGYATHRIKVPNRNVRPHWCFTKTVACTLLGSLPADVSTKIAALYDAGITFWKNPSEVGNYSLDNSV